MHNCLSRLRYILPYHPPLTDKPLPSILSFCYGDTPLSVSASAFIRIGCYPITTYPILVKWTRNPSDLNKGLFLTYGKSAVGPAELHGISFLRDGSEIQPASILWLFSCNTYLSEDHNRGRTHWKSPRILTFSDQKWHLSLLLIVHWPELNHSSVYPLEGWEMQFFRVPRR